MFIISKITHTWLIAANIHYGSFCKPIESLSHLKDFKALVIGGLTSTKIVKILVLSSFANGFFNCSFGIMKYLFYLKTTQVLLSSLVCYFLCFIYSGSIKRLLLFIEIKNPLQPLVDGLICSLSFVITSINDGNNEQFQFNYILQFDSIFGQLLTLYDIVKDLILGFSIGFKGNENNKPFQFYYIFQLDSSLANLIL